MKRLFLILVLAFFASFGATPAHALLCSAITGCSCNVDATNMAFGNINPLLGAATTSTSTVSVQCTGVIDAFPAVLVKVGAGANGTMADRKMKNLAGNTLSYNIYSSNLFSTILGDGTGGFPGLVVSGGILSLGSWSANQTLHGKAPADATARTGAYTDTVTVRIDW